MPSRTSSSVESQTVGLFSSTGVPTEVDEYKYGTSSTNPQPGGLARAMAVLTNKPVRPAREICAALGLAPYFLNIYGGNSFATKKPDPEGLLALMAEAGATPDQTVMIGDSQVDVETARNAGAWVVGCTFGLAPESLRNNPPDVIVDSPADWTAALAPA